VGQRRWIFYKIAIFLVVVLVAAGSIHLSNEMKKNEAIVFVEKMGVGWNLGNTLDTTNTGLKKEEAHVYEMYWGNPKTTREMIKEIHDAGFSTIRIPITWKEHMDEDGKIDADWMKRVHEVVDYSIEEELFVIINTHHDDWYYPSYENESQAIEKMKRVWDQISAEFITKLSAGLHLPKERFVDAVGPGADLFSSSLPYALEHAYDEGIVKPGDTGLIIAVGSGIQVGCAIYHF